MLGEKGEVVKLFFFILLLHFTYTDKMKAQINEKSTVEISLYTHSSLKDRF